jgi:pimeloyl-ACP methyl ester carboxylesterase
MAADFAQDVLAAQTATMTATQGPIRGANFAEPVTHTAWRSKPSWYIATTQDRMIDPGQQQAMAKSIGARTITLRASHVPMLSKPKEVADVIAAAALAAGR